MGTNFEHLQLVGNIKNLMILKYLDMIFPEMKKELIHSSCTVAKPCRFCYSKKDLAKNERIINRKLSVTRQNGESQNFPKNENFLPPDTHTYVCVSGDKKCSFFRKIWRALFSWNTHFEIRLFALLPTKWKVMSHLKPMFHLYRKSVYWIAVQSNAVWMEHWSINPVQSSVSFHIETDHLIYTAMKWVK